MTDFEQAVQQAFFDRLTARVTKARVYQHVPADTPPPVVFLGDLDFEDDGTKGDPLLRFTVQVMAVVAGPGRKPLNALRAEVFAALDRWRPEDTAAVAFGEVTVGTATVQEIQGEHGPIYFGQHTATVMVQAAD